MTKKTKRATEFGGPTARSLVENAETEGRIVRAAAKAKAKRLMKDAEYRAERVRNLAKEEHNRARARLAGRPVEARHLNAERLEKAREGVLAYLRTVDGVSSMNDFGSVGATREYLDAVLDELVADRTVGAAAIAAGKGVRYWLN